MKNEQSPSSTEKRDKSPEDVAAQIAKISGKLIERARKLDGSSRNQGPDSVTTDEQGRYSATEGEVTIGDLKKSGNDVQRITIEAYGDGGGIRKGTADLSRGDTGLRLAGERTSDRVQVTGSSVKESSAGVTASILSEARGKISEAHAAAKNNERAA